ncbi:hypothetical protein [Bowmanella denitrificans]|uniref:hypothetical protein n=1 Tax=Bowmanella denitrificans TaxID=366582 RepID=UPI000C9BFBEC|nr:hypothetical protein [Bowmanella denitrificans]
MRYIDNTFLEIPEGWDERALEASRQLLDGERTAEQLSQVWRVLKACLSEASNRRCWYCESTIHRSDNAVDHYRPKGTVKTGRLLEDGSRIVAMEIAPVHHGYKWKAFNLDNFRYSCEHCNEYRKDLDGTAGGKWNYFPLVHEERRAYDAQNERFEVPVLLDPCKALDWQLLSYDSNGRPFSRFDRGTEEDVKIRFSIRLLHLDQQGLNEGRRSCWSLVSPILRDTKYWFVEKLNGNPEAEHNFQEELRKLKQWLNPRNPATYIGFVRYKLRNDRDKKIHPWIDMLLGDI